MNKESFDRLPIKVVVPSDADFQAPENGGGSKKVFDDVTPEIRRLLSEQVSNIDQYFSEAFKAHPTVPAVARVTLKEAALAKSHRPTTLFDSNTCPIIGIQGPGQLLVSVKPQGLRALKEKIVKNDSKSIEANISTIEKIEPYRQEDAVHIFDNESISSKLKDSSATVKIKLFKHGESRADDQLLKGFLQTIQKLELPSPEPLNYGGGLHIYRLKGVDDNSLGTLSKFIGTQSVSDFPEYTLVRSASTQIRKLEVDDFPVPDPNGDYPVVGLIDSGTDPNNTHLQSWVVKRYDYIPKDRQDNNHGSFVAGLLINAQKFNHGDPAFPNGPVKLIDVVALSNETTTEDELITILDEVVRKHPDVRVWNLSLASSCPASDWEFSDLAVKLDTMQSEFGVQFVLAAGNLNPNNLAAWPRTPMGEIDRLAIPADSALGIAVGAIAHTDKVNSLVRKGEPSPFSRRGPGAMFLPKPEITHYGGNCTKTAQYTQTGVISLDANGGIAEDIGTSFSTPLISCTLANIEKNLQEKPSLNLIKALMIHSAVLNSDKILKEEFRYRGFGIPGDAKDALSCSDWAATMILEFPLIPGFEFIKDPFPLPSSLRKPTGEFCGEIAMTLVYDPPLDPLFGSEYCRRNVEVSLGTYDFDIKQDKRVHNRQIHLAPKDYAELYEKALVEHGFKWSPVKVYRRKMPRGVKGDDWRLKVSTQNRSGFGDKSPQDVVLIITIMDPQRKAQVYNELVQSMNQLGWITKSLDVQNRMRLR